jgi:hypothetical protein
VQSVNSRNWGQAAIVSSTRDAVLTHGLAAPTHLVCCEARHIRPEAGYGTISGVR